VEGLLLPHIEVGFPCWSLDLKVVEASREAAQLNTPTTVPVLHNSPEKHSILGGYVELLARDYPDNRFTGG